MFERRFNRSNVSVATMRGVEWGKGVNGVTVEWMWWDRGRGDGLAMEKEAG